MVDIWQGFFQEFILIKKHATFQKYVEGGGGEVTATNSVLVVVVVVFYYCDMGQDCYNCYILKTGSQLTPRAIVGL